MIFKAIVTSSSKENEDKVYITIPILDGASSKEDFKGVNQRLATICSLPGCIPRYAQGDVVFVDFEQDNMLEPIIIGSLMSSKSNNSVIDLYADSLTVDINTQLSGETFIDDNQALNNQSINVENGSSDSQPIIDVVGLLEGEGGGVISAADITTVSSLRIDTVPIASSVNLITSGGVYNAIQALPNIDEKLNEKITYGSTDLVPGQSSLPTGVVYLYYE